VFDVDEVLHGLKTEGRIVQKSETGFRNMDRVWPAAQRSSS